MLKAERRKYDYYYKREMKEKKLNQKPVTVIFDRVNTTIYL
jgi:hypothetical protein